MAQTDRLIEAFKSCAGPYPWRDFEKLMRALGYEKSPSGGGSGRKFKHPDTKHLVMLHEPHDGEMKPGMVRRLRDELEDRGIL